VEVVSWNHIDKQAELWVKVPTLSATVNTILYLYYDATHADNDTDADNTGKGINVVTWKFEYTTSDGPFNTPITHSFIARSGATGSDPILNSYKWTASWVKDSDTSAKIFSNHTMLGS